MPVAVQVQPATAGRWDDLVTVFGRRGQDPSWCWCQLFVNSATDEPSPPGARPNNQESLREEIARAPVPPGLIAYVEDQPVGWTRVGPRCCFPRVSANRALARVLDDDPGIWWVACFAIHSRLRRTGIGSALLEAAVTFARDHGATAVEGHPVDTASLSAAHVSGSALFTGTMAMFVAAGFSEVARTFPTRPVMRLTM
ncbi:MAG: GNAT family N-acetyltransferase [Acidimicrobiales bacterium]